VMAISLLFDNALRVSAARREQVSDPVDGQVLEFPVKTPGEGADTRSRRQGQTAGANSSRRQRTVILNETAQRKLLKRAPMEFSNASTESQVFMTLPMPDGTSASFRV